MNYKNLIKAGAITGALGLLVLIYNFFNMYGLVSKCPEDIDVQPCQAYNNWQLINKVGLVVLILGVIVFIIGFAKRQGKA